MLVHLDTWCTDQRGAVHECHAASAFDAALDQAAPLALDHAGTRQAGLLA
ncbi:hypothetical protein ACQPZP_39875 [Spirillospora sp. CA-142024]